MMTRTTNTNWELEPGNSIWFSDVYSKERYHYGVSKSGNWYLQRFKQYYEHEKVPNYKRTLLSGTYVKRKSYGIQVLRYERKGKSFQDVTKEFLQSFSPWVNKTRDTGNSYLSFIGGEEAHYGLIKNEPSSIYVTSGLTGKEIQTEDPRELAEKWFGKRSVRKDLVKLIVSKPHTIKSMSVFRGLVPIDWIISTAKRDGYGFPLDNALRHEVKSLFSELRPLQQKSLIEQPRYLKDTYRLYEEVQNYEDDFSLAELSTDAEKLHDELATIVRRLQREHFDPLQGKESNKAREISAEKFKDIHEKKDTNGLRYVVAQDRDTLRSWSITMSNCISSYSASTRGLIGVYEEDKLVANLEIDFIDKKNLSNGIRVYQCLGKYNQSISEQKRKDIYKFLKKQYGKVDSQNAWV